MKLDILFIMHFVITNIVLTIKTYH